MEETAVAVREKTAVDLGTLRAESPEELLACASAIATPLAVMIDKQGLSNSIQGRRYVRCEGWTTMGAMLGVIPREVSSVCDASGVYTAVVELIALRTGMCVGRASAECGSPDEVDRDGKPVWANRPAYAKRSMAVTRATSKAFRLSFSWIMTLAGYEATPAEEVPDGGFADTQTRETPASQKGGDTTVRFVGRVVEVTVKDGTTRGTKWRKWGIKFQPEGEAVVWLGTFDEKLARDSRTIQASGLTAVATCSYDGEHRNLLTIAIETA